MHAQAHAMAARITAIPKAIIQCHQGDRIGGTAPTRKSDAATQVTERASSLPAAKLFAGERTDSSSLCGVLYSGRVRMREAQDIRLAFRWRVWPLPSAARARLEPRSALKTANGRKLQHHEPEPERLRDSSGAVSLTEPDQSTTTVSHICCKCLRLDNHGIHRWAAVAIALTAAVRNVTHASLP